MSDRNRLSAGDFIVPLPVGIPVNLKYDENGVLTNIYKGYDGKGLDLTLHLLYPLVNNHIVPNKIALKNGTTHVSGTLCAGQYCEGYGRLPDCKFESLLNLFKSDPKEFKFFAVSVTSLAAIFNGAIPIRQWLAFSKFNVPKGFLLDGRSSGDCRTYIFDHCNDNNIKNLDFDYFNICDYAVFSNMSVEFGSFDVYENIVSSTDRTILESGVIEGNINFKYNKDKMLVPYSEIVQYNIKKNTVLIYDSNLNILYSKSDSSKPVKDTILCPTCGKIIHISKSGVTMCTDVNCNSRLYPRVKQFLIYLHLPYISYSRYIEVCREQGLDFRVPDILKIDEFNSTKFKCTVFELIRAITPKFILSDDTILQQFCNTCNNSYETVEYYLKHPKDIQVDISSNIEKSMASVVNWYSNEDNMQDLDSLFHNPSIELILENRRFDGAPIFRGKSIAITGSFVHGDFNSISNIIKSYGANISNDVNSDTCCIVVGDLMENISSSVIKQGKKYGVPVLQESEFFERYDIDSDIKENL